MKTTKKFPLHAILTMRTGVVMGDFGEASELIEWALGHPVWTHEMPRYRIAVELKLAKQFPQLPSALPQVTSENYADVLRELEAIHGKELEVENGGDQRDKNPIETALEAFGPGKLIVSAT